MKYRVGILLYLIVFIIETTILPHFSIFNVTADISLAMTIVFIYLYDNMSGIILGTIFTLIRDIIVEPLVGTGAISVFCVAILVYLLKEFFNKENFISIMLFSAGGTITYNIVYWTLIRLAGYHTGILYMLERLPIMIILNTIIAVLIYLAFIRKVIKYKRDDKYNGGYSPYRIMFKK